MTDQTTVGHLIYEHGPLWQHLTGVHASDPALAYVAPDGVVHVLASDLDWPEWSAKATATLHAYRTVAADLKAAGLPMKLATMAQWLVRRAPCDTLLVPPALPAALWVGLQELGLKLEIKASEPFIEEIQFFNLEKIALVAQAQRENEQAFLRAFAILREADIASDNLLVWRGTALTAETLQAEMKMVGAKLGAQGWHGGPITACGVQGGAPHERGHGPLRAHELMVIDNFPQAKNGYWGDLTRTVLKGTPSQWQRDLVHTVTTGQQLALGLVKDGALGWDIHNEVMAYFDRCGFKTGHTDAGVPYGYTHSLGHPIGLDLRGPGGRVFGKDGPALRAGHVVTIEPGLYYPVDVNGGVGGCRVEDIVAVTVNGCQNLTNLDKENWVIS